MVAALRHSRVSALTHQFAGILHTIDFQSRERQRRTESFIKLTVASSQVANNTVYIPDGNEIRSTVEMGISRRCAQVDNAMHLAHTQRPNGNEIIISLLINFQDLFHLFP